jgi:Ser/Thr protein kinase RdoA (MazF antagonist)
VLRRYADFRSEAAIAYEHDALRHAASAGWPVAQPIAAAGGATCVTRDGERYVLFPHMPGTPASRHDPRRLRINGRLLARLHDDMARFAAAGQRDGWGRTWEEPPGRDAPFNESLRRFGAEHRELASMVRRERYRSLRELSRLGYGDLPDGCVHFDFHHDNLFFEHGRLTAVLDFDSVHLDARVVDIAASIANDCAEPPAEIATDVALARAFVGGYMEHAALEEQEIRLIVPMLRAYRVWSFMFFIPLWRTGDAGYDERIVKGVHRSATQRLPALASRASALERAFMEEADAVAGR